MFYCIFNQINEDLVSIRDFLSYRPQNFDGNVYPSIILSPIHIPPFRPTTIKSLLLLDLI